MTQNKAILVGTALILCAAPLFAQARTKTFARRKPEIFTARQAWQMKSLEAIIERSLTFRQIAAVAADSEGFEIHDSRIIYSGVSRISLGAGEYHEYISAGSFAGEFVIAKLGGGYILADLKLLGALPNAVGLEGPSVTMDYLRVSNAVIEGALLRAYRDESAAKTLQELRQASAHNSW